METNITFSGAGFLGIYHIGVVSCLKFYGKRLLDQIECFGGSSAGALTACMLLTDMDLEASVQFVMYLASKVNGKLLGPFNFEFDPVEKIRKTFMTHLPTNAYKVASGKLHISLTRVSDWKNVIVNDFSSNKELVDALVCTSFVPFFSGVMPPKFRGESYIDGGFTDNLPQHFSGTTITVSPFSGESDICPDDHHRSDAHFDMRNTSVQFTSHNIYRMSRAFFAPDNDTLSDMCRQGFRDALKYLHANYHESLDFGVAIVSIPQCCGFAFQDETSEDDANSICSCGNTTSSMISDIEHAIAKGNAINKLVFPDQLNKILVQTNELFRQSDLCWYLIKTLTNIVNWLIRPCYYATEQLYSFIKEICRLLLPRMKELSAYSIYTEKAFSVALEVLDAYYNTAQYQWHPSMKEEQYTDVENSKLRLKNAQQSLVTLPNVGSSSGNTNFGTKNKLTVGCNAPPPSRVASFAAGLTDYQFFTELNEIVFDVPNDGSISISSESVLSDVSDENGIVIKVDEPMKSPLSLSKEPFCLRDDDGLVLKLDRDKCNVTSIHFLDDDYGCDLQVVVDSIFDAVVIGGQVTDEENTDVYEYDGGDVFLDDAWNDYVNIGYSQ